jgi:hypothetical protein
MGHETAIDLRGKRQVPVALLVPNRDGLAQGNDMSYGSGAEARL